MNKSVLVPLASGFEEIEAVTVIDVLRRAGLSVTVAGLPHENVQGAHGVRVQCDTPLERCADIDYDLVVLPGGMPGAKNLAASGTLQQILARHHGAGKPIGAICAAPAVVLKPMGLLPRGNVACYPSFREQIPAEQRTDAPLAVEKGRVTAAGPGAALTFALALVSMMCGADKAEELGRALLVAP